MKRKVITGISLLTCYGNNINNTLSKLDTVKPNISVLKNNIGRINRGYIINDLDELYNKLNVKSVKCLKRINIIGIICAIEAYNNANLTSDENISMTCAYPDVSIPDNIITFEDIDDLETMYVPSVVQATILAQINQIVNNHGKSHMISSACASGLDTISDICNQIELGQTEVGIAIGCDSPIMSFRFIKGLDKLKVISKTNLCRPFDKDRDGLMGGEGGAALVIEELEHAKKNKKRILAEIKGYDSSVDAVSVVSPHSSGIYAYNSMVKAITNSNIIPNDIGLIMSHGTGTIVNDNIEAINIDKIFNYDKTYVTAIKSHVGHTASSNGIINAVFGILSMNNSIVPGILNFNEQSDNSPKINISSKLREKNIENVLINAYGFGGYNSSMIISKYNL